MTMDKREFTLFIAGRRTLGKFALSNLTSIFDDLMPGQYTLEVVDVFEQPERAEKEKIIATPLLVREAPPPIKRIIGDFSDREQVIAELGLQNLGREFSK